MWEEVAVRLGIAVLLGALVGFERQWRSHYVGLRTTTLVTLGSAGMTVFALTLQGDDPSSASRIISQIIPGIGFLCAGVLIREGANVKGFHTAAALWCSVAVGMFTGAAMYYSAAVLAGFIMLVNMLLRPVSHMINKNSTPDGH